MYTSDCFHILSAFQRSRNKKMFSIFSYFLIYSLPAIPSNVFSKVSVTNHVLNDMYHFSLEGLGKIFLFVC